MSRFLFFDTETTGVPRDRRTNYTNTRNWPRVVQIAWVVFGGDGREHVAEEFLVRPDGFTIPSAAVRVHGITTRRAREDGAAIEHVMEQFLPAVESAGAGLVAHNLEFDRNVIGAELHRLGLARPDIERNLFRTPAYCTMEGSTAYCRIPGTRGRLKWPTLEQLHRRLFGTGVDGAHGALADVRACARCFFRLREMGVMR